MQDYKTKSIYLFQGVFSAESLKKIRLGPEDHAFVCEGRPSLEAGRKSSEILFKRGITPTMISDNMAGFLFFKGLVKEVIIACQYADQTGALCDIGALILAVLAKEHKIPIKLLVAEKRTRFLGDPQAISSFEGQRIAPKDTHGYVPLVEWVPVKYLKIQQEIQSEEKSGEAISINR
jgi:methylthioribose-1-phosphate isomerase